MTKGEIFEKKIVPILSRISPRLCTKLLYKVRFKKSLDFNNPVTLNEKVLWLKFNTYKYNPIVKRCADKLSVRGYLKEHGFANLLIELIAAYDEPHKIDWDSLPNSFAIKMNTGSGMNIIVKNKNELDIRKTQETITQWFKNDFWTKRAELQYKNVKPYVLFEKNLSGKDGTLPEDYKFYCMNGKADSVMVCKERNGKHHPKFFFLDRNWKLLPYTEEAIKYPNERIDKPSVISEAFDLAEKLSDGFPFVRVDLFIIGDVIYFGELTFTPAAGLDTDFKFVPPGYSETTDMILGKMLKLPGIDY